MNTNDDVWRRPPGDTASPPAAPEPPPPARPQPRTGPEDAAWARPAQTSPGATSPASAAGAKPNPETAKAAGTEYTGPPPTNPPPPNWRPPIVAEPVPPGILPEQDHDRMDVEEQAARTLTTGIGLVAGAILLVLLLILCARAVF
jgi:hypothetical protein